MEACLLMSSMSRSHMRISRSSLIRALLLKIKIPFIMARVMESFMYVS